MSGGKRFRAIGVCATALLSACSAGPNYHRPEAAVPPHFKEAEGWAPSQPSDQIDRGDWWSVFNDPVLDHLEEQVAKANQTVKEYEAAYREATQVTAAARATLFPTVGATAGTTTTHTPGAVNGGASNTGTTATVALEASWVPDLWGKVRRTVESDRALAQASNADLANARLAAQATLAQDYFTLRVLDEQAKLYGVLVKQYQEFVNITTNQVKFGTQPQSAVLTAQTQLYAAQASQINVGVQRAAMEHAIAVLMGQAPAQFSLAAATLNRNLPVVPVSVPSTLLERRPDIAGAERRMASANALIGVATSAYFPTITLSGEYGTTANNLGSLFGAGTNLWSLGTSAVETLLDFGARKAQVRGARAAYDEAVATYRQTVLTGMQGVEDELAAVHIYAQESEVLLKTEKAAHDTVQLDLNEYKAGTVDYTTVITAQATELSASQNVLVNLQDRFLANVLLIEDLGGGWTAKDLAKK